MWSKSYNGMERDSTSHSPGPELSSLKIWYVACYQYGRVESSVLFQPSYLSPKDSSNNLSFVFGKVNKMDELLFKLFVF